jgi:hypothetical protein
MRVEITAIFCIAAIVVIFLLRSSRGALTGKHFMICALAGLVLTFASLLYSETRYSGTILQEFRGFPRSFYLVKKASPGEAFSPGSHFHWRFFIENLLIYTSALVIVFALVRRFLAK